MTIAIDDVIYKRVFVKMPSEKLYFNPDEREITMTFTVLGNNVTA